MLKMEMWWDRGGIGREEMGDGVDQNTSSMSMEFLNNQIDY